MALQHLGVPYAHVAKVKGRWSSICPDCGQAIAHATLKDADSFDNQEYVEHYESSHGHPPHDDGHGLCRVCAIPVGEP
jgi:hypothetical protein